jgi:hypothetical protein
VIRGALLVAFLFSSLLAALFAGAASTALPDVVLGFDDLAPGRLTSQLQDRGGLGQGVLFASPFDHGFSFTNGAVEPGKVRFNCGSTPDVEASSAARSGGQVAMLGSCGVEEKRYGTFGVFPRWRTRLTIYVRAISTSVTSGSFVLTAYDYRRNPIATRSVDTAGGGGWQSITVTASAPSIAYFALYWDKSVFGSAMLALDDLTYDQPEVPPAPQISISRADGSRGVVVHQGETVAVDFTVTRWNGSVGNVALQTDVLNPEIDAASFSPNPAGGTQTKLLLHARINPDVDSATSTSKVTATPLASSAGTSPDSHSFPLDVLPVFGFRPIEVNLPACTPTTVPTGLSVAEGFRQPITLAASVAPALVDATLTPASYVPGFSGVSELKLYARPKWLTSLQDAVVTVTASSPGYPTRRGRIILHRVPSQIEQVVADLPGRTIPVTELETQRFLKPPDRIAIRGVGFCPGTKVEFGNKHAVVAPVSISQDGIRMVVDVPRLATDGPIGVILPGGQRLLTKERFAVRSFRHERGFSWVNRAGRSIGWDEFVEVFGYDQTHLSVDACPFVPFVRCDVTTPEPSPLAVAFFAFVRGVGTKGLCFGMSTASLRIAHQVVPLSFFSPIAKTIWELPGVLGSAEMERYIHKMHLLQMSYQLIFRRNTGYPSASAFHDDLVDELRRHEAAIVGFRSGESGHAVVAYDVQELGGGAFDVLTYNPNDPYDVGEADGSDAAADLHRAAEERSTLHVRADGSWSFSEFGWSGPATKLYLIPYREIPFQPKLPQNLAEAAALLFIVDATGSARIAQVTNPAGQSLFAPGGRDNLRAFPGASVLAPLDSREGPNPTLLLPASGTYTVTLRGRGRGAYSAGFLSRGLEALVQGQAAGSRSSTQVTLDGKAGSLTSAGDGRPLATTLVARARDGSFHTATLRSSGGAGSKDTLAFDGARDLVTVRHSGPAAAVSLELGWTGSKSLPTAFTSPALRIGPGETLTFAPGRWQALDSQGVSLTQTRADGSKATRTLRSVGRATAVIRSLKLRRKLSGRRLTLTLTGRVVGRGRADALATVTFLLLRGKRVVARSSASLPAPRLGHPVTWRSTRLRPGRYTAVTAVTVLSGRPGSIARSAAGRATRLAFSLP